MGRDGVKWNRILLLWGDYFEKDLEMYIFLEILYVLFIREG
jgi:hypothetical protein